MDSANSLRGDVLLFHRAPGRPAEELALDEALLDFCEAGEGPGFLRFWEPSAYFVVLGYSKALELEADRAVCTGLGIPILRRCSGGGTVLQGPGALNYTLVLPASHAPELATITGANRWIMERNRSAVAAIGAREAQVQGHTDLAAGGRKFSGNAQRRKQRSLLFHGSFLLNFDLDLISRTLRLPAQQPEYRARRAHADFLINLQADSRELRQALMAEWGANQPADAPTAEAVELRMQELLAAKYDRLDWHERF